MRPPVRPARPVLPVLVLLALSARAGCEGVERTLFKDMPADEPVRRVVEEVLASPFASAGDDASRRAWADEGFAEAWARARRYFPDSAYLVRPGTYFMTHGFGPGGRMFMEVHASAYLDLCVGNLRTFGPGTVVGAYARMLGAADGREAAAFRDKTGRLEPAFRDGRALDALRRAVGADLFRRLLEGLRREDYHMIAGGLLHEGMHAGAEGGQAARVEPGSDAAVRAVQWDELRAFMAEAGYHALFWGWAGGEIAAGWSRIGPELAGLEPLRRRARLGAGKRRARFDRARSRAWARAALVRLRLRESWQSARRVEGLASGFRADYFRPGAPAGVGDALAELALAAGRHVAAAGEAIRAHELALRDLEEVLDRWGEWADGLRPFPPPVTDTGAVLGRARAVAWPEPPAGGIRGLRRTAEEALAGEAGRVPRPARRPGSGSVSSPG